MQSALNGKSVLLIGCLICPPLLTLNYNLVSSVHTWPVLVKQRSARIKNRKRLLGCGLYYPLYSAVKEVADTSRR
jgi:hypothetical protein